MPEERDESILEIIRVNVRHHADLMLTTNLETGEDDIDEDTVERCVYDIYDALKKKAAVIVSRDGTVEVEHYEHD